jgi:hypothetical protein
VDDQHRVARPRDLRARRVRVRPASAHAGARGHSRDRRGAVLTTEVLKPFVFERPALLDSARDFHNSYPSGHTTIAYAVGIAATIVAPRRARRVVAAAAFLCGTGIGLSTVLAGWHRPSDVVGGLLVATAWAARTVAVLTLTDADAFGRERPGMRPALDAECRADQSAAPGYVLTAVGVVGAGWIATDAVVLSTRASSLDLTHADAAFVWACAAIVGFAAIVFAALLMALRPALPRRTSGQARPVM